MRRTQFQNCYPAVGGGTGRGVPRHPFKGCSSTSTSFSQGFSCPGCVSVGLRLSVARLVLSCAFSARVFASWHSVLNHWRLLRSWLSPGLMWSHSAPCRLHPGACLGAWHLPRARARTWRRILAQFGGRRLARVLVDHAMVGHLPHTRKVSDSTGLLTLCFGCSRLPVYRDYIKCCVCVPRLW